MTSRLADTKAAGEVKALDDFYKMLQNEPDRAFYGLKHVEKANEAMAVDILLISDELFRHQDVATRSRYVRLVDGVRENMGTVRIFSSLHVSGEQLGQLTGVAAILRFPVAELSDQEDESSSEEDWRRGPHPSFSYHVLRFLQQFGSLLSNIISLCNLPYK